MTDPLNGKKLNWAIVIFASREAVTTLRSTIEAALIAAQGLANIDVLVNGNAQLGTDIALSLGTPFKRQDRKTRPPTNPPKIRIWAIPLGDKANAWNQYIHRIWAGESIAFFIDGYVRLNADSVQLLGSAIAADHQALGGSGVPTVGRSASALRNNLIVNTGLHGNFCCIKGTVLTQMRETSVFLPVGLYRTDSLMGAFLCYALDPSMHVWDDSRILVHQDASWQIDVARWWHPRDVKAFLKRYGRQARGRLENKAVANHMATRRQTPQSLPATAKELVLEWAQRCPEDFQATVRRHLLAKRSFGEIRNATQTPAASLEPILVWQGHGA